MTLRDLDKAPFSWFGGKSQAADLIWSLLGDVPHYVEPFFGSGAVLLGRPHPCNRPYFSETVNDLDGFVVNFWRAVQFDPVGTAVAASGRLVKQPRGKTREPGVRRNLPHLTSGGRGVNHPGTREPGVLDVPPSDPAALHMLDREWGGDYHDLVMPELIRWFRHLAARLRHVRVLNGDWSRLVTTGAAWTLPVRQGKGPCGVFLDPPYADSADRASGLYASDDLSVAHDVREWCLKWGDNPKFRIVLAGFEGEHGTALADAGWSEHEWFTGGFLRGGMGNLGRTDGHEGHQQHRERLWASPHCLVRAADDEAQETLWTGL